MKGKTRAGSVGIDGEGASAREVSPVVQNLEVQRFAQRRASGAAGCASQELGEDGARDTTAYSANGAAKRADERAGLRAGQRGGDRTRRARRGADGAADSSRDMALLGAERLARRTRICHVTDTGTVAR